MAGRHGCRRDRIVTKRKIEIFINRGNNGDYLAEGDNSRAGAALIREGAKGRCHEAVAAADKTKPLSKNGSGYLWLEQSVSQNLTLTPAIALWLSNFSSVEVNPLVSKLALSVAK